jgi:hypothetical protein
MPPSYRMTGPGRGSIVFVRTAAFSPLVVLALVGCSPAPTYLEAHGHFGDGTAIDFRQNATLQVGADTQTGVDTALLRSVDNSGPPFMGMVVKLDLTQITAPGQYTTHHDGSGGAQIHILVPAGGYMNTTEYMADGSLDLLELPTGGNDRLAGSFSSVVVSYDNQDITVDQGTFRGQL